MRIVKYQRRLLRFDEHLTVFGHRPVRFHARVDDDGFLFDALRQMGARVLPQVVLTVETFAALGADFGLFARMDDRVKVQMLFSFEACKKG